MYQGYRIIAVTAAGRRRYMQLLFPYVLSSDLVDQYDIWVNTVNKMDIAFFQALAAVYPKINLVWSKSGIIDGVGSMNSFYEYCQDENTIYIKLDDDVVWMENNFFEEICRFRVDHPDYFLVTPLVINNGIGTFILQNKKVIEFTEYFPCQGYDLRFLNGGLAEQLHKWFIEKHLFTNSIEKLHAGTYKIAMQQFPINAVSWFGSAFKKFDAKIRGHDEIFLTVDYPSAHNLISCYDCDTVIAHYAFNVQMKYLDKGATLDLYHKAIQYSTPRVKEIYNGIQKMLSNIDMRQAEIEASPLPLNYRSKKSILKHSFSEKVKKAFIKTIMNILGINNSIQKFTLFSMYMSMLKYNRKYIK